MFVHLQEAVLSLVLLLLPRLVLGQLVGSRGVVSFPGIYCCFLLVLIHSDDFEYRDEATLAAALAAASNLSSYPTHAHYES